MSISQPNSFVPDSTVVPSLKDLPLDQSLQRMCLILSGAIALYEQDGPEICRLLLAQQKEKLYLSLDLLGEALYWLREQVKTDLIACGA